MPPQPLAQTGAIVETILGIVDRVTYHNPENGWSVLRVSPFNNPHQQETVIVHQTKVFAGHCLSRVPAGPAGSRGCW